MHEALAVSPFEQCWPEEQGRRLRPKQHLAHHSFQPVHGLCAHSHPIDWPLCCSHCQMCCSKQFAAFQSCMSAIPTSLAVMEVLHEPLLHQLSPSTCQAAMP